MAPGDEIFKEPPDPEMTPEETRNGCLFTIAIWAAIGIAWAWWRFA